MGRRIEGTAHVTELVLNKKLVQKARSPFPVELSFSAEPTVGGTKVTLEAAGEPGGFFKVALPILGRVVKKQGQAELDTMKALLEAQDPARVDN